MLSSVSRSEEILSEVNISCTCEMMGAEVRLSNINLVSGLFFGDICTRSSRHWSNILNVGRRFWAVQRGSWFFRE